MVLLFIISLSLVFFLGAISRGLTQVLLVAWAVRMGLVVINHNFWTLIPVGGDSVRFFNNAISFSELGFFGAIGEFTSSHSSGFSAIMGAMLALFGPSILVIELLNLCMGVVLVALTYKLAKNCGADSQQAKYAAMVMALVPSVAQYSVVSLREMVIVLPFMMGVVALTRFSNVTAAGMIVFSAWCGVAALFHGGMIFGVVGLGAGIFVFQRFATQLPGSERLSHSKSIAILVLFIFLLSIANIWATDLGLAKVSEIYTDNLIDHLNDTAVMAARGESAYLTGMRMDSYRDVFTAAPLRLFYFFLSPLPWDIKAPIHFLGLMDVVLYVFCFTVLWRAYKNEALSRKVLIVFGIIFTLSLVYAFGSSNAGTASRHRAKFSYALVAVTFAARSATLQSKANQMLRLRPQLEIRASKRVN
jgi:hypothetical protein